MTMIKPQARHKARRFALQALYQQHFTQASFNEIKHDLLSENNMAKIDMDYFDALVQGVISHVNSLDEALSPYLARPLTELDPITRSILRLSTFELTLRLDVPCRVVLDEAVQLAKIFGAEESYTFVNAALDKVAAQLRKTEYQNHNGNTGE